ncbi:GDP-mannose 4,6-dehydratase [Pelotomaculum terephthalicicum JT]|uniref:GDP-mannose 4,6-dehydratase n=1 Tax=Pelotomaculum terephthalicicum TaxID=206393 RepID=UPI001F034E3B|nr:GDP-mannose 4,6-dehydratase [Pelotomaculum terephthalicicum]MCG9966636.1 GDP-mannose 4,6-dehydratase [Pelotomaculum terephthalicicum JT]
MSKKALITGITGQDGAYLSRFLLEKGYNVYGAFRRTSIINLDRLESLGIKDQLELIPMDLTDQGNIVRVLQKVKPDEIYNLAAQSFVAVSFEQPVTTGEITGLGTANLLEAIRAVNPEIKFYQASTSEMFGKVQTIPQNEETPFYPRSPYSVAKLYAHWMTVNYREAYGIFTCSGILFNHESPLRGLEFVTRKITHSVARIKLGLEGELRLGNMEAKRDWGYAPEFVKAMWLMLQHSKPDNYVVATGETHSVKEFVEEAFSHVGLDWHDYVVVDPSFYRPAEVELLVGDYTKAREKLGWQPKTTFRELVKLMVEADMERVGRECAH